MNNRLKLKGKYVYQVYASELGCDPQKVEQFIHDCIHEFDLFQCDDTYFWSESLLRRMKLRKEKSEKARQSAKKRYADTEQTESEGTANAERTQSERNASAMQVKESKVKESKVKESKIKENIDLETPVSSLPPPHRKFKTKVNENRWDRWWQGITAVVDEYNSIRGKSRSPDIENYVQLIGILFENDYTVQQCKMVVRFMWQKWKDEDKMLDHHEPETLFALKNFSKYLIRAEEYYKEIEIPQKAARKVINETDRLKKEVEEEKAKSGGKLPEEIQQRIDKIVKRASA